VKKEPIPTGADGSEDLEACMTNNPVTSGSVLQDSRGAVAAFIKKLTDAIVKTKCTDSSLLEPFPGPECNRTVLGGSPSNKELSDCLVQRVFCRFCQMINAVDDLSVNCTDFANSGAGTTGYTCP